MKACCPGAAGSGTKRCMPWAGRWTTARRVSGSGDGALARSSATRQRARFARCGNGCPGIDGERREHREERRAEVALEERAPVAASSSLARNEPDSLRGQQRHEVLEEAPVLLLDEVVHRARDRGQRLGRGEPVRAAGLGVAGVHLALEPGHADHEELVEVRAEDSEELDAFEQRHRRVLRLLEHAAVELEPGQLAVDVGLAAQHRTTPGKARLQRSPWRTRWLHTVILG